MFLAWRYILWYSTEKAVVTCFVCNVYILVRSSRWYEYNDSSKTMLIICTFLFQSCTCKLKIMIFTYTLLQWPWLNSCSPEGVSRDPRHTLGVCLAPKWSPGNCVMSSYTWERRGTVKQHHDAKELGVNRTKSSSTLEHTHGIAVRKPRHESHLVK